MLWLHFVLGSLLEFVAQAKRAIPLIHARAFHVGCCVNLQNHREKRFKMMVVIIVTFCALQMHVSTEIQLLGVVLVVLLFLDIACLS